MILPTLLAMAALTPHVLTGAEVQAAQGFPALQGKRIGLVTNHTAMVRDRHLIDLLHENPKIQLTALFGPEHGLRGLADAGEKVADQRDPATNVPIFSLYGENRRPTLDQLQNVDLLVFDIQDIGARFYTYISTLGLCMQSAAEAKIPFLVLDRPNPLGGEQVSGWIREPDQSSFVGLYPIPIQHGLTVAELAQMIKGEAWLPGLENLDLQLIPCQGWDRAMLWPQTNRPWIKPSPNIPDFETALVYPGTCLFEGLSASEGRGTTSPFLRLGHPDADVAKIIERLKGQTPGLEVRPATFTPRSIPGMSASPKQQDIALKGIDLFVRNPQELRPVETGVHLLHAFFHALPDSAKTDFFRLPSLARLSGTPRLAEQIAKGDHPAQIIESWSEDVHWFKRARKSYLLYP